MKQLPLILIIALMLASCNTTSNNENDKKNTDNLSGIIARTEGTAKNTMYAMEAGIANIMTHFEATHLKNEPERSLPRYERAREVKKSCDELFSYMNGLKGTIAGQAAADFEKTKTELFGRIDEVVKKMGSMAHNEQTINTNIDPTDKASFTPANAVIMITLMELDLKGTELYCIDLILGRE